MPKENANNKKRNAEKAAIVKRTARITGVSERSVYRVVEEGTQKNEVVMATYIQIVEESLKLDNALLDAVNQLVPFD